MRFHSSPSPRAKVSVRAQEQAALDAIRRDEHERVEQNGSIFAPIPAKAQGVRHSHAPRHYLVLKLEQGTVNSASEVKLLFRRGHRFLTDPGDKPLNVTDFVEGTMVQLRYGRGITLVTPHKV